MLDGRPLLVATLALAACAGAVGDPSVPPDFTLEDVNPNSATYEQQVGPADFEGEVSAWYFGWATCPLCQSHVDALDVLATDERLAEAAVPVSLLGINEIGYESGNDTINDGHTLPWLQDVPGEDVFDTWPPARIRELKIVGRDGVVSATFDLNDADPNDTSHADAIVQALLDAAEAEPGPE